MMAAATLALFATISLAQQASPAAAAAVSAVKALPAPAQLSSAAKPGQEGLKVHGHWKIVVKNPDGSIASTTEFNNALVTPGAGDSALVNFLTGSWVPGDWGIFFVDNSGWCKTGIGCLLVDSTSSGPLGAVQANRISAPVYSGASNKIIAATATTSATLVISGAATATMNTSIIQVGTVTSECLMVAAPTGPDDTNACLAITSATSNANFNGTGAEEFTLHVLPSAIPVVAGQIVQFTVTISFS